MTQTPVPPPQAEPAYATPTTYAEAPAPRRSGVGALRHLASLVLALLLVPAALVLLDFGAERAGRSLQTLASLPAVAVATLAVGFVLLLLAGATGRLSGLGPLAAGLLWGAAPTLWLLASPTTFVRVMRHLPDVDGHILWFTPFGYAFFPTCAALLLSCAISGRWR
jgi:hypothetical protein